MAFHRATERAGLNDVRLHDARHTFTSYQAMSGVQSSGLQALPGHKDARTRQRYSHLSDAYLRSAVNNVVLGGVLPNKARSWHLFSPERSSAFGRIA
jgi:site-specific recombinase XerD